mmetsp:Transcript_9499/g.22397  ORF Transcript_9499/g.22397 Transcript_9499/m.22397 type:complete len:84 (-) Transcript_9499:28-279(-)|eukprot:scaffold61790_cov65-Phaeocystis_antarctica.AAC.3
MRTHECSTFRSRSKSGAQPKTVPERAAASLSNSALRLSPLSPLMLGPTARRTLPWYLTLPSGGVADQPAALVRLKASNESLKT